MYLEALQPGDVVDIIAPASKCTPRDLTLGVNAIRQLGLVPRVPQDLFAKSLLFSNQDSVRLKHLKHAIYAQDSKLIWSVRGGYGSLRLMPDVENWPKPKRAKIFLGYSDLTTLHAFLNQKWNWPTLHGPMVGAFGRGDLTKREQSDLVEMLFGELGQTEFTQLKPLNAAARKKRHLKAPILGGNLVVLLSGLGTPSALKPKRNILFFEDTNERPHRVDRMLNQLRQAGWFENIEALLLGDFLVKDPADRRGLWQDVFPRFAGSVSFPVLKGLPVGHKARGQRTLPLNTNAELILGARPFLKVDSGIRKL